MKIKSCNPTDLLWLAAFLLCLAMLSSHSFQECINQHAYTSNYDQNSSPSFFDVVLGFVDWSGLSCVGGFVHHTHDEILAGFTILLAIYTFMLWNVTKQVAEDAKNSAKETIKTIDRNTRRELRAYISVIVGTGVYQETGKGVRFEAKPTMINNGKTPARKVSFKAAAAILPAPLPDAFTFPLEDKLTGGATLGAGQTFMLSRVVDSFVLDSEVAKVKLAIGNGLYIWGIVVYRDIFGRLRKTEFCQTTTFIGVGSDIKVMGYYHQRHNNST